MRARRLEIAQRNATDRANHQGRAAAGNEHDDQIVLVRRFGQLDDALGAFDPSLIRQGMSGLVYGHAPGGERIAVPDVDMAAVDAIPQDGFDGTCHRSACLAAADHKYTPESAQIVAPTVHDEPIAFCPDV